MFQRIQFREVNANNEPIYSIIDSCYSFDIIAETPQIYDTIIHSACAEALACFYDAKHLNVAKNLALYYKWMVEQVYGDAFGAKAKAAYDLWLESHRADIDQFLPQLQFGKKYHKSIIQYLIKMGCYQ